MHTMLTRPVPKNKITLGICAADNLFFWINTKPNFSNVGQLPLVPDDHPQALTHPCFLDCSRVTTFPLRELQRAHDRGPITKKLAARIVDFLNQAPPRTLAARHLRLATENLEALLGP